MGGSLNKSEQCSVIDSCQLLEAERELWIESLRAHLSEQRHDFFNLLQVLYGYTQLEKHDRVLEYINNYCRQMENIGRLYNAKCIKLADLLYNKSREADNIDLKLKVGVEISYEPETRKLDSDSVCYVTDQALSTFFYMLDTGGLKGATVDLSISENPNDFRLVIDCRDLGEGKSPAGGLAFPEDKVYWKKLGCEINDFPAIIKYCADNGLKGELLPGEAAFICSFPRTEG